MNTVIKVGLHKWTQIRWIAGQLSPSQGLCSKESVTLLNLTFIGLCIANIFAKYNQQDVTFLNLFISVRRCTCFRWFFRPSSGAQNCAHSVMYWSDKYLTLCAQFWAPDDGWKNHLKHVQCLTEINKLRNVASCWLYFANTLLNLSHHVTLFYLLCVVLVELRLSSIASPQTKNLVFWAVSHINKAFKPPPFNNRAVNRT